MKTIKNIEIKNDSGKVQVDPVTGVKLNTANLIYACLGHSSYKNNDEQWQAHDIYSKLKELDGKDVELEEAEFALVKEKVEGYAPFKNGFHFMPFLELFR